MGFSGKLRRYITIFDAAFMFKVRILMKYVSYCYIVLFTHRHVVTFIISFPCVFRLGNITRIRGIFILSLSPPYRSVVVILSQVVVPYQHLAVIAYGNPTGDDGALVINFPSRNIIAVQTLACHHGATSSSQMPSLKSSSSCALSTPLIANSLASRCTLSRNLFATSGESSL